MAMPPMMTPAPEGCGVMLHNIMVHMVHSSGCAHADMDRHCVHSTRSNVLLEKWVVLIVPCILLVWYTHAGMGHHMFCFLGTLPRTCTCTCTWYFPGTPTR